MSDKTELFDKNGKALSIADVMHRALLDMEFTKCDDDKYRRCQIHDLMNVVVDDYGYLWINSELEHKPVEIPITMFKDNELDKFKQWIVLTHGA